MRDETLLLGPIIGGLSHNRVFLWGRANALVHSPLVLHAWIGKEPDLRDGALAGQSPPLSSENGWAGVVRVSGLTPETRYFYHLSLNADPPLPGKGILNSGFYPSFITFPEPGRPVSFNFAFGSCFRPVEENEGEIFHALETRRVEDDLRFILLLGDQIYADDYKTNSLGKVAETLQDYRDVYAFVWSRTRFRQLLYNLPAFMTLDDHEVDDDWRWLDVERREAYIPWWDYLFRRLAGRPASEGRLPLKRVQNALQAYWEHQGMHAPPMEQPLQLDSVGRYALPAEDPGSLAYTFEYGAAAFFVMDTRTMRVKPRGWDESTMLGEGQWRELESWFIRVKDVYPLKFLISSGSLLHKSWLDIMKDRWSGFPHERDRLLSILAENGIEGVYVLSGDLHLAYAIRAALYGPGGSSLPLWEFCSSPFEQNPNKWAGFTRVKIRNGILKNQDCKFVISEPNFGVVRVNFEDALRPEVSFELYGGDGKLLQRAGD